MQPTQRVPTLQDLPPEALRGICDILMGTETPGAFIQGRSPNDQFAGLHTVLSLTRTSRVLHEHAADAIWDTIPGFGLLVYTLPLELWTCRRVGGPAGPLELVRVINLFYTLLSSATLPGVKFDPTSGEYRSSSIQPLRSSHKTHSPTSRLLAFSPSNTSHLILAQHFGRLRVPSLWRGSSEPPSSSLFSGPATLC